MTKTKKTDGGFTIVEVVVTLAITAIFLTVFFQMYLVMESQRVSVARRATASNISYSNLRKITDYATVQTTAPCDSTVGAGNTNNLVLNASAVGSNITSLITTEPTTGLYGTVTQTVRAFYPRGCVANMPVKVQATTTYGSPQESVVHASYIN